jgi:hypothetical protein
MSKFYTPSDAADMYTGHSKNPTYQKVYERINRAIAFGELGRVRRLRRGWLLTEQNLTKLRHYMERKWGMRPLSEAPQQM